MFITVILMFADAGLRSSILTSGVRISVVALASKLASLNHRGCLWNAQSSCLRKEDPEGMVEYAAKPIQAFDFHVSKYERRLRSLRVGGSNLPIELRIAGPAW